MKANAPTAMLRTNKAVTTVEDVVDDHVNRVGAEYLRRLWQRREAAMSAPFTVDERALLRDEPGQQGL